MEYNDFENINYLTKKAFSSLSENYKQKLVYNLLNLVKSGNQGQFYQILIRSINSNIKEDEFKDLINKIFNSLLNPKSFDKYAYSIILGIMASKGININDNKIGETNE